MITVEPHYFRRLHLDDVDSLAELAHAYSSEMSSGKSQKPVSQKWLRELLEFKQTLTFGVFADQQLLGFAIVFELPDAVFQTLCGQLDDLFVKREFRGRGIAKKLIEFICDEVQKRKWSHLRWVVPENDTPAIQLYEKIATQEFRHSLQT